MEIGSKTYETPKMEVHQGLTAGAVAGGAIGNLFGQLITIDTTGVDFAMTALFIVICTEQWMSKANRLPAVVGCVCACLCLAVFGRSSFILPAMVLSMAVLLTIKNKVKEPLKELWATLKNLLFQVTLSMTQELQFLMPVPELCSMISL